jgi:hypothetical protein
VWPGVLVTILVVFKRVDKTSLYEKNEADVVVPIYEIDLLFSRLNHCNQGLPGCNTLGGIGFAEIATRDNKT